MSEENSESEASLCSSNERDNMKKLSEMQARFKVKALLYKCKMRFAHPRSAAHGPHGAPWGPMGPPGGPQGAPRGPQGPPGAPMGPWGAP